MQTEPAIPPSKRERLAAFLGSLPASVAGRLFAALEADRARGGAGLPYRALINDLRARLADTASPFPARPMTAQRLFFTPFEDLFVSHRPAGKRRARIARASLEPVWALIVSDPACAAAGRAAAALDKALAGAPNDAADIETKTLALCDAALIGFSRLVQHADADRGFRDDLARRLGGDDALQDFAELHLLLPVAETLRAMQALFPRPAAGASEEQIYALRALHERARAAAPEAAPYLFLALLGRMEAPARGLGVHYALARAHDGAGEDAGVIAEALFEDLETLARELEAIADGDLDTDDAGLRIAHFAQFADGLLAEARRAGDNASANRIEASRDIAAECLARYAEQALAHLRRAMPVRHAGGASRLAGLRPDIMRALAPRLVEAAREAAQFLSRAQELAKKLGRYDLAKGVVEDAATEARRYAGDVVLEIRAAEGEERLAARRLMEQVLAVAAPLLPADEAGLLKERARVAAVSA